MSNAMPRISLAVVFALTAVTTVAADPDEGTRRGDVARAHRADPANDARMLRQLQRQMGEKLDLDEEQTEEINAMFEDELAYTREQAEQHRGDRREDADAIRELVEQLSEARRDGDRERMAELREQIAELRKPAQDEAVDHQEFFDDLRDVLDDQQLPEFEKMIARLKSSDKSHGGARNTIQLMRRAADLIDVTPEQRETIRGIYRDLMPDMREAAGDEQAMADLETDVHDQIVEVLDEDQVASFEQKFVELRQQDEARRAGPTGRKSADRSGRSRDAAERLRARRDAAAGSDDANASDGDPGVEPDSDKPDAEPDKSDEDPPDSN